MESTAPYVWGNGPCCLRFTLVETSKFHCSVRSKLSKEGFIFLCILGYQQLYFTSEERAVIENAKLHRHTSSQQQIRVFKINSYYSTRFYLVSDFYSIIANKLLCSTGYAVALRLTRKETTTHN